ncbi:MAG: hypothetical protein AYK18_13620 [Theionarchaea archaeon DG-70]|nr:MAG: hypothetical protein AYK18_13620 [Theionarchaea archaeon DG-70]
MYVLNIKAMKLPEFEIHVIRRDINVVYHPQSSHLFIVDDDIAENLEQYEHASECEQEKVLQFYSKAKGKEKPLFTYDRNDYFVKELALLISQDCNLRCRFCYANFGAYHEGKFSNMPPEIAEKALEIFLPRYIEKRVSIKFFGGEPLLNFDIIRTVVKHTEQFCKKTGQIPVYPLVTNGTLITDEMIDFFNKYNFNITVSLDGPKEVNDQLRLSLDGSSVHDTVAQNVEKMNARRNFPLNLEATITSINSDMDSIHSYLLSLGVDSVIFGPVEIEKENPLYISPEKVAQASVSTMGRVIQSMGTESPSFEGEIGLFFRRLRWRTRFTHNTCGAGLSMFSITTKGDVYPCYKFVGIKDFYMGNIQDKGFPEEPFWRIHSYVLDHEVDECAACKDCWARYICLGYCYAANYFFTGDPFTPDETICYHHRLYLENFLVEVARWGSDPEWRENFKKNLQKRSVDRRWSTEP